MYVPIDDEDAIDPVSHPGVPRSDGDVAEQTKAHRSRSQSVMAGGPDGAEAARRPSIDRHVDGVENASGTGGGRVPGARARDGVWIELAASGFGDRSHTIDVSRVVRQRQFVQRCVASLHVDESLEEIRVIAQSARNRA
jgi:hypothetical protein